MKDLEIITTDTLYNKLKWFIEDSNTIIGNYEDTKLLILNMIKQGYMFNMDRDRLRDAMEDITYMLCPDDDANKDRVERGLEYDDSDSDDLEPDSDLDDDFIQGLTTLSRKMNEASKQEEINKEEESKVEETPVEETPVEETPVEETPVEESQVEESQVEETPVEESKVEESQVEESQVEEDKNGAE